MSDPRPCPFCGCADPVVVWYYDGYCVECPRCFASGPWQKAEQAHLGSIPFTEQEAVEAWNKRVEKVGET